MEVLKGINELKTPLARAHVTIGNFDGLHMGHRQIVKGAVDEARRDGGASVVFTFRPHPRAALKPGEPPELLTTYDEKLALLAEMGLDYVIEQPFGREFSTYSPEQFFGEVLLQRLSAVSLHVGYDFGFGKGRAGNLEVLRRFCEEHGVKLVVTQPFKAGGIVCSSSKVRELLRAGDVSTAAVLLGRPFFYRGLVVKGDGRGRKIGFPTANIAAGEKILIAKGVYVTESVLGGNAMRSVTNVGSRPTFTEGGGVAIETHVLGFTKDIYGETLEVRFLKRLRDEMKFPGVDALVAQIRKDAADAHDFAY